MLTISQRTAITFAMFYAWEIKDNRRNRRLIKDLRNALNDVSKSYDELVQEHAYMIHLLNKHGVQLDEFDLIALPHVKLQEV